MQRAQPTLFQASTFKIQKRGSREKARIENFAKYLGPDAQTKVVLAANLERWTREPLLFWSNPVHPMRSRSPSGQLVEFYMNARCDDA